MAKRGTLTHRRTRRLAAILRVPPPYALGVMEAVWHVTAAHAPAGDIGRLRDQDLADELYWDGDAGELVAALVSAGVLETHPVHRLVVHGWSEHADSALRHKLKRARTAFWDGSPPFGHAAPPTEDDVTASDHDVTPTDAITPCVVENLPSLPVPVPSPVPTPEPAPTPTTTNAPPGPPASRVGTGGAEVHQVGDRLRDGRVVLEVDEAGRAIVVSRGEGTAPSLTADARAAVERIVEYAAKALGHRFDRSDRRRLRERLLGGESEAQILGGYRAQVEALEALETADDPAPILAGEDGWAEPSQETGDDEDLDQALRLSGAAPLGGLAAAGRSDQ